MSKWHGKVGYAFTEETEPGIWEEKVVEKDYYGDVISNRWMHQSTDKVNENLNLSNTISIVADEFAYGHCSHIIYVVYLGEKWKVSTIEPQRPRLLLTIGGVYNESSSTASE